MNTPNSSTNNKKSWTSSETNKGISALFLGAILFSGAPVFVAGAETHGMAIGYWRIWFALGPVLLIAVWKRLLNFQCLKLTFWPGVGYGVATSFFYPATQITSVANATLITVLQPIPLLFVGAIFFNEYPTKRKIGWTLISIAGSITMVLGAKSRGTGDLTGDFLAIGSLVFMALYFSSAKRARESLETIPLMTGVWLWAGIIMTPVIFLTGKDLVPINGRDWFFVACIAAIPGTGHFLTSFAQRYAQLALVGVFQLLTPVISAVFAFWFLDQVISLVQGISMVVVVTSLTFFTLEKNTSKPTTN